VFLSFFFFRIYYLGNNALTISPSRAQLVDGYIDKNMRAIRAIGLRINLGKRESWNCIRVSIKILSIIRYFIKPLLLQRIGVARGALPFRGRRC